MKQTPRSRTRTLAQCRFLLLACGLFLLPILSPAQVVPGSWNESIVERGAHHRRIEATFQKLLPDGRTVRARSAYVELATGMHVERETGWVECSSRVEPSADGQYGLVQNLQYSVIFAANLAAPDALDLSLPGGERLTGRILGLAYAEGPSSVLIAEPTDTIGEITGPEQNRVTYNGAFTDLAVDVFYEVEQGRFSQNLVIRERLPSPTEYGLTENATLLLMTEWTTFPTVHTEPLNAGTGSDSLEALGSDLYC